MVEVFQVIVDELARGRIGAGTPYVDPADVAGVPPGWVRDRTQRQQDGGKKQQYTRLLPLPPILSNADLHHLSRIAGQPPGMISFALVLMRMLGILELDVVRDQYTLMFAEDRLQDVLGLSGTDALTVLTRSWLAVAEPLELYAAVGSVGPLLLNYTPNPYYYAGYSLPQPMGEAVRRMVGRVVGRLAVAGENADAWYDFGELLDLLWSVSPALLTPSGTGQPVWWFSTRSDPQTRLDLGRRSDWQAVWSAVVQAILTGPMTWLGLVDVAMGKDHVLAFRPRAGAATLVAQEPRDEGDQADRATEVELRDGRPLVRVPAGRSNPVLYSLLRSIAEMVDASAHG
jgi:hypothetical protein